MKVQVLNLDGSAGANDIELSDEVFGIEPRADILHRVVTWQLENRRGIARATRERSEVSRTGKKFGRQKGGGTARHGDRAAPMFIGGGKAHGARRREFDVSLNKKVRALGPADGAFGQGPRRPGGGRQPRSATARPRRWPFSSPSRAGARRCW